MKKRVYLVLTDENIFHPYYYLGLLRGLRDSDFVICGVTVALDSKRRNIFEGIYLQGRIWGIRGLVIVALISLVRRVAELFNRGGNFSIENISKRNKTPFRKSTNVNSKEHLNYLRKRRIDILISSNGQIFKDELLRLPKIASINRHTALLPKYGGVLPVFWAMLKNEKEFGVSIHFMEKGIDEGDIIYQSRLPLLKKNSLFRNYVDGFNLSIDSTLAALEFLNENKISKRYTKKESSYFRLPKDKDFSEFRKKGLKTIEVADIYYYIKKLVKK